MKKSTREFLNRLQVGYKCRNFTITVDLNKQNEHLVNFFFQKNWIKMYNFDNKKIIVYLRYVNNKPLFTKFKFISTSGHRKYFSKKNIPFFKKSLGGSANILMHTACGLHTVQEIETALIDFGGEIFCVLYE